MQSKNKLLLWMRAILFVSYVVIVYVSLQNGTRMSPLLRYPLWSILFFAIPLSVTEICIEKSQGWGAGMDKTKWYGKSILRNTKLGTYLMKTSGLPLQLNFHLIIAWVLFPSFFLTQFFYGGNLSFGKFFIVLSSFFIAMIAAEITWFSCNSYFDSWAQLRKGPQGNIWWHHAGGWKQCFGKNKYLPKAFFKSFAFAVLFFAIALCMYHFHY